MKPFAHVDASNNTLAFHNGTISTVGPVTLTNNAASDLVSVLLQWNGETRVIRDPQ